MSERGKKTLHREKDRALFYPRAWIYVRSRDRQRLAEQKLNTLQAAQQQGLEVVGTSEDVCGRHSLWRPGLFALVRAVCARFVDVVVVPRLSRLAVHRQWLGWLLRLFHEHGVAVITTECELRYDLYRHGLDGVLL